MLFIVLVYNIIPSIYKQHQYPNNTYWHVASYIYIYIRR